MLRQAGPVTLRDGVERHQIREPDFHRLRREADDREHAAMAEQVERGRLPLCRAGRLEDLRAPGRHTARVGERLDLLLQRLRLLVLRIEREQRAVLRHLLELVVGDVNRDDRGAERRRHLHPEAADAADADEHGHVARRETAAQHRLIRRGDRVGDHRQGRKVDPERVDLGILEIGDRAEPA